MPITNQGLILTLHDIKLICRHKFFLAQTIHGFSHPQIEGAILDIKTTFREFDHSEVWLHPLEFDTLRLMDVMIELDRVQVFELQNFINAIEDLTSMLQNEILAPPMPEMAAAEPEIAADRSSNAETVAVEDSAEIVILTSDMNLKVLNQLQINSRKTRNKERVFKRQGEDLSQNAAYQTAKKECREQLKIYRECLKINAVDSVATDIIIFEEIGRKIQSVTLVPIFQQIIEKYTEVVLAKLPPINDDADPIDEDFDEPIADSDTDDSDPVNDSDVEPTDD